MGSVCEGVFEKPDHPLHQFVTDKWIRASNDPMERFSSVDLLLARIPADLFPPTAVRECVLALYILLGHHRVPTQANFTVMRDAVLQFRAVLDCLRECIDDEFRYLPWTAPSCHSAGIYFSRISASHRIALCEQARETRAYKHRHRKLSAGYDLIELSNYGISKILPIVRLNASSSSCRLACLRPMGGTTSWRTPPCT